MLNLRILLNPPYLFNTYPSYQFEFLKYFLIFFGFLVLLAIVSTVLYKLQKKSPQKVVWEHLITWAGWSGVIGLFFLFVRYEGIPYFAMRIWLVLWTMYVCIWFVTTISRSRRELRRLQKEKYSRDQKDKYRKK